MIFIRAELFPLHTYHYCLSQCGRRLIYRLPENRLVVRRRRHRHCNDCNEVRPKVWNSLGASIAVCRNLPPKNISTDTGRSIRMIFCIICFQTFRNVRVILISHFGTSKLCPSVPLWGNTQEKILVGFLTAELRSRTGKADTAAMSNKMVFLMICGCNSRVWREMQDYSAAISRLLCNLFH